MNNSKILQLKKTTKSQRNGPNEPKRLLKKISNRTKKMTSEMKLKFYKPSS